MRNIWISGIPPWDCLCHVDAHLKSRTGPAKCQVLWKMRIYITPHGMDPYFLFHFILFFRRNKIPASLSPSIFPCWWIHRDWKMPWGARQMRSALQDLLFWLLPEAVPPTHTHTHNVNDASFGVSQESVSVKWTTLASVPPPPLKQLTGSHAGTVNKHEVAWCDVYPRATAHEEPHSTSAPSF